MTSLGAGRYHSKKDSTGNDFLVGAVESDGASGQNERFRF